MNKPNNNQEEIKHRVITMLDRPKMDFLDKIGKDALFSTGHKLSYNEILEGLVNMAMEMGISGENINSSQDLQKEIFKQIAKNLEEAKRNNQE